MNICRNVVDRSRPDRAGDYEGAIRSYSLCLGLKARNHVAFSNRAMAYLKQGMHRNAEARRPARAISSIPVALGTSHVAPRGVAAIRFEDRAATPPRRPRDAS